MRSASRGGRAYRQGGHRLYRRLRFFAFQHRQQPEHPCPCCGSRVRIIEIFLRGQQPKRRPTPLPPKITIDTLMTISQPPPRKAVCPSARSSAATAQFAQTLPSPRNGHTDLPATHRPADQKNASFPGCNAIATTHPPRGRPQLWPAQGQIPIAERAAPPPRPLPAISCLGAFRTPAVTPRGQACHAGVRKPAQNRPSEPFQRH
jgi:hypothetical protein